MAMGITSVRASFRLVGSEQLAAQGVCFRQVHKGVDSASCRRGSVASPVCGKAANRSAGKVPCAEIKPSAERTCPLGCISAPLVPKVFSACRSLGSFFQIFPRWLARQGKPKKRGGFLVGHVLCFRHNAFKDRAPDNKAVVSLPAFLAG